MTASKFTGALVRASSVRLAAAIALGSGAIVGCSTDNNTTLAAAHIATLSGDAQTGTVAGTLNAPFVVKVTDKNGNPVQGAVVTFTASNGASLMTSSATTDASGLARDSITVLGNTSGAGTVTASVSGASTPATFNFTASPGAAATVVTISGNNQSSGAGSSLTVPLVAEARDQFGNPVPGVTINWTTSAGTLSGNASAVTDATGRAQILLQLPAVIGPVTVTAKLNGTATQTTFTETATGGQIAGRIAVVSGDVQTGTVAGALGTPVVVKVTDANGLPVQGVTVTFAASGGATLRSATATTDAAGLATDSLMTIGTTAGAGTITASVSGVATNAIFNFTANPGPAAALVMVSGNSQTAAKGTALPAPLVVKVTDSFGNVVSNATVTWTTSAGSIAGSSTSITTSTGLASASVLLPSTAGPVTITASLSGTALTTVFTATAM